MGADEAALVGVVEATVKYHFSVALCLTGQKAGTVSGGQFDWGGRLPKGNGGAQRFPQAGWKSAVECKGREGSLTVRRTGRTGTKVGLSDPTVLCGRAVA